MSAIVYFMKRIDYEHASAIANTFLFEMMKSKSKDVTLAAIYALGEGRCQAENITRELHRLSQSDDMEIKIAAIKALGRIYR